jgi:hypothetical protein
VTKTSCRGDRRDWLWLFEDEHKNVENKLKHVKDSLEEFVGDSKIFRVREMSSTKSLLLSTFSRHLPLNADQRSEISLSQLVLVPKFMISIL